MILESCIWCQPEWINASRFVSHLLRRMPPLLTLVSYILLDNTILTRFFYSIFTLLLNSYFYIVDIAWSIITDYLAELLESKVSEISPIGISFRSLNVLAYYVYLYFIFNCRMSWTSWHRGKCSRRRRGPLWSKEGPSSSAWCLILRFSLVLRRRQTGQGENSILKQPSVVSVRILRTAQRKTLLYP